MLLRQEYHSHAVLAARRQLYPPCGHVGTVEFIRDLDQQPGAVTHQLVRANRAAVIEILQDQQALLDDRMGTLPLDMSHETDATGVVFTAGIIKTVAGG